MPRIDGRPLDALRPVDPVGWTVREFVLVRSLLGLTMHIPLARWKLRVMPQAIPRRMRPPSRATAVSCA